MATTYPGTIDSFTNPSGTSTLDDPDHALQHSDANDAIEAIEAVIGTTAGTSVLMDFSAGEFPVRQEGGTVSPGTLTLDSPTLGNATLGTPAITGGTATGLTLAGTPVLDATSATPFYGDSLHRQAIINGNFDVWQRGTSTTTTGFSPGYIADRWYTNTNSSSQSKTISRQDGTDVDGSRYCIRIQADSGATAQLINTSYSLETQDSIKLRGQYLTLSFYARAGADFSATDSILVNQIRSGTGTDEKSPSFTGAANIAEENKTLTTSWQKFTTTTGSVVADTVNQLGIGFYFTTTGTSGAGDYVEIAQVQLCAGTLALPFMPKSFDEELKACQRYYEKSYNYSVAPATSTSGNGAVGYYISGMASADHTMQYRVSWKVNKRTTPTVVAYSEDGSSNKVTMQAGSVTATINRQSEFGANFQGTNGSASTVRQITFHYTADAEL